MKNFKKELARKQYYNSIVFWMTSMYEYDFSSTYVKEILGFVINEKTFDKFIKEAVLDEDQLSDFCAYYNTDYNKMHKDLEELGFDLV